MTVKETPYAIISIHTDKGIGKIQWKGTCTSQEYRASFLYLIDLQSKYNLTRFLSDVREQGTINPEDRKWFEAEAVPKSINMGLKAAAVVFNGNAFKKYYLNLIIQATNKFKLPLKLFGDVENAEEWLVQQG